MSRTEKESLEVHLASYMESMHGFDFIKDHQKQILYKSYDVMLKDASTRDHSDAQARQDVIARSMMQRKK